MTKGDLSGHVKSYHDTVIDIFAFSYGDKQEKATLLKNCPREASEGLWGPVGMAQGPEPSRYTRLCKA